MQYIWLAGTKEEIEKTIQAFKVSGFTFEQGELQKCHFLSHKTPHSCLLHWFVTPSIDSVPQPKAWDAVLGGKN